MSSSLWIELSDMPSTFVVVVHLMFFTGYQKMEFQLEAGRRIFNLFRQGDLHQVKHLMTIVLHVVKTVISVLLQPSLRPPNLPHSKVSPWSRQQKQKKTLKKHTTTKSCSEHFSHENFSIPHPIQCELSRNSIGFLTNLNFDYLFTQQEFLKFW